MKKDKIEKGANVERRKQYWLQNCKLFYSLKRKKGARDPYTWIFAAWEGNKYDDNSRYLFEYVSKSCSDIDAVWFSKKKEIVQYIRSLGYKAELIGSNESKEIQLKAGVAFYTNGLDDFGDICYFYGAIIVSLWHGVPVKNIYYLGMKDNKLMLMKTKLKDEIFSWVYRDYTISSSDAASDIFANAFGIAKKKSILVTGFPRYDILFERVRAVDILPELKSAEGYKYILYMPTYRKGDESSVQETIDAICEDRELLNELKNHNYRFLVKPHYLSRVKVKQNIEELLFVTNDGGISTQHFLSIADMLITDYSSCYIDYSITGKPIFIYTPDFDKYTSSVGIEKKWILPLYRNNMISDYGVLKSNILGCIHGDNSIGKDTTEYLNNVFYSKTIRDTCFCENVHSEIIKRIKK